MTATDSPAAASKTDEGQRRGFGIDVGGSGVKGGIVDLDTGLLIGERFKLATPQPATPDAVAKTVAAVVREFGWTEKLGVTYPGCGDRRDRAHRRQRRQGLDRSQRPASSSEPVSTASR